MSTWAEYNCKNVEMGSCSIVYVLKAIGFPKAIGEVVNLKHLKITSGF